VNFLEPAPTPLDLRWRLFGTPCRVHPSFWVFSVIFGMLSAQGMQANALTFIFMWVLAMFLSVLFHEVGHVTMGRIFGEPGHIVLYSMGGYAMGFYDRLERWQRILVAAAGPVAGFLFLGAIVLFDNMIWNFNLLGSFRLDLPALRTPWCLVDWMGQQGLREHVWYNFLIFNLLIMNLFWSIINLLPVIPLDGGNILKEISTGISLRSGLRFALGFSFLIAGLVALYSGFKKFARPDLPYPPLDPTFNLIIFALLAFQNYSMLQNVEMQQRRWEYMDD
jgi:Zn-dependent protease